ncbi:uncharacterized protein ACA1_333710 [Acanthamoeba castellanii str. Neff]|uniref:Uncharacterized protein n=1 Tax=Acanthamoeba castellanii (strain ATCC 30010 / Neff) TaxID=1257118 RepID=L8GNM7_ACACF|nr:uncharacterized protein ACA1_333710 [Acanthamoeba castellanii str. Neff]ELR14353.1 hypothetical protein ACA1_333710 [Acanthamoeba castellanii str. Neff]
MTNFVSLVLLVFIVTIAFLAAAPVASASVAQSKAPDAFLLTLQAECGAYVAPLECLPFLTAFKWPLSSFRVEGPVVPLTQPVVVLQPSVTSYVLFNAKYTTNWTVEVNYNEPNQPGFSLHAWWIKTPFTSDGLLPKVDHPHFSVIAPFAPEHLPCPGAAADANCTMAFFPIVISYNGGGLNMTTTLSAHKGIWI